MMKLLYKRPHGKQHAPALWSRLSVAGKNAILPVYAHTSSVTTCFGQDHIKAQPLSCTGQQRIAAQNSPEIGLVKLLFIARGYLAVILSHTVQKSSWLGCDPIQSKTIPAQAVDTTSIAVEDQQLTTQTTGPEHATKYVALSTMSIVQAHQHTYMPSSPFCICSNIFCTSFLIKSGCNLLANQLMHHSGNSMAKYGQLLTTIL